MRHSSRGMPCGARLLLVSALTASAFLLQPAPVRADPSTTITFSDAVRIALERNITLRQSKNDAALDDVALRQARQQFLPSLSLGGGASQTFGAPNDAGTRSLDASASAGLTLFDGFGNLASLRSARLSQSAGRSDVQRSKQTVVFTVASNFLSLVQQQEQLRVQREALTAASALDRQISEYVDAGTRTVADRYLQQAVVANAQLTLVESDRAWQMAQADLMLTLQLDPTGSYTFEAPALPADSIVGDTLELNRLLARAWAQREDLTAGQARSDAARQNVRVAGAAAWPNVSLSARYGSSFSDASGVTFADQFDERRGGSLGLGVSLPIFDRGGTAAARQRARIQVDNSALSLESQRQTVGIEVRRAYLNLRAAREQLRAAGAQERAAELWLRTSQERYEAGAATFVELAQARATRVQAAGALVSGRYNLLFQRVLVDYYVGESDPAASLTP
jgi:outer membrane protein